MAEFAEYIKVWSKLSHSIDSFCGSYKSLSYKADCVATCKKGIPRLPPRIEGAWPVN